MRWKTLIALPAVALAAVFASGCSTTRTIDSAVATQSTLRSQPTTGYRFERLPSQQSGPAAQHQAALEGMAQQALTGVGMRRDEARPGYSVAVGASTLAMAPQYAPYPYPMGSLGVGFGGRGRLGWGVGLGVPIGRLPLSPQYHREVSLVMRDLTTGQVVYETRAVHDGPWSDDVNILPILFQAAVTGYPTPPSEKRIVKIDLLPAGSAPSTPATTPASSAPSPAPAAGDSKP